MNRSRRRPFLFALAALLLGSHLPAQADEQLDSIRKRGRLKVAVYNNFPPYSDAGKGIDVELGEALAAKLGLKVEIIGFLAGEDMGDDLRNMVWKGHYLGTQPADVMMHVPVDEHLAKANDKVRIFGPYHREMLMLARNPERIPPLAGSAAVALEIFTREKIGVEIDTLADAFLLGVLNGRLQENVVHFKSVGEAAKALREGRVSAVLAPRAEIEAALGTPGNIVLDRPQFAELRHDHWPLGMAVKAEADDLAEALSRAVEELRRDGTLGSIFKKYGVSWQPA